MSSDVRSRSREILRAELADAAASFCAEHGFDEVSVDQIARGIGVSRATFFRYFASKEEAVVSAAHSAAARDAFSYRIEEALARSLPDVTIWAVIHLAAESMIDTAETRGDALRARVRMISDVPSLAAYLASQRHAEQEAVADVLRQVVTDNRAARVLAVAGVMAADLAWQEWARTPGAQLKPLLDAYFAAFGDLRAPGFG